MAVIDKEFNKACKRISNQGREYENKNRGVKRLQVPSITFQHDLSKGFPAITNKRLPFKFVKGELIWFLRGDTNVKYLVDNGIPIWNKDAYNLYVKVASANLGSDANHMYRKNLDGNLSMFSMEEFINIVTLHPIEVLREAFSYERYTMGDVGRNYSAQWRNFRGEAIAYDSDSNTFIYERHDQIKTLLEEMVEDIMSSRLKVEAWNPSELGKTALPPCHDHFQVIGVPLMDFEMVDLARENGANISKHMPREELVKMGIPEFGFEMHWNQRSVDTFLGLPFNIASYGTIAKILEEITGFPALAIEGTLKCVHFYDNQYEAVQLMMSRDINKHSECEIVFSDEFKALCKDFRNKKITVDELFKSMQIDMIKLKGYTSDEAINVEMLAPIKI
jgi:thymidylate synthase